MGNKNTNLQMAKNAKDDEFYTTYETVENLILTYETKQCPLNADKVEMILQEYFGCSKWDAVVG